MRAPLQAHSDKLKARHTPDRLLRGRLVQLVREADPKAVSLRALAGAVPERTTQGVRRLVGALVREGMFERSGGGSVRLASS